MYRVLSFAFGVACHVLFLAVYAYMAGFVGGLVVPKSIESAAGHWLSACLVDVALMAMFGVQHTVMARPWFKERWTKVVPMHLERSVYVLISCVLLMLMMWQWRGVDLVLWRAENPTVRAVLWGLFALGWLLVPAASFMINHFDLFGTRQVFLHLMNREYRHLPFRTPMLYQLVRHPLYLGWFIAFWAAPKMTLGHAVFAAGMSLYILIAVRYEERDLVSHFGDVYRRYQKQVPAFLPTKRGCPMHAGNRQKPGQPAAETSLGGRG